MSVVRNVTVQEKTRVELTRAKETAAKAKGQFLSSMSHKLRTPLTGALSLSHLLLQTPLNAEQSDLLYTMIHSGETLLAIVNSILDFSKLEANQFCIESIPFFPQE